MKAKGLGIFVLAAILVLAAGTTWAQVTIVGDPYGGNPYVTIQAAVNACSGGETINVAAGTYTEWQDNGYGQSAGIIIDKSLHLQGSGDDCVIRGKTGTKWYMGYCPILWVKADNVEINSFKFDGATYTEAEPKGLRSYGIQSAWKVGSTDYAATNLNVHHNTFVYIGTAVTQDRAGGGNITVAHNTMVRETRNIWYDPRGATSGSYVDKTLGGGGFKFDYVAGGSVHDNTGIETPGVGIFLHSCDGGLTIGPNNVISAPNTTDPSDVGIHIQGCDNITVKGDSISNFTAGAKVYYKNGTTGAGIRIISSNNNVTVEGNELHYNTVGVLVTGASGSPKIHLNNIKDNEVFGVLNCGSWIGEDRTYTPASYVIDATNNWWGHASGPGGADGRVNKKGKVIGKGDAVSGLVDWNPWLPQPVGLTPHDPVPPGLGKLVASVDSYALCQNNPNPCNPETNISYSLAEPGPVTLRVYNLTGQLVRTLVDEVKASGTHSARWNGRDDTGALAASGVYFYRMVAGNYSQTKRMLMLK